MHLFKIILISSILALGVAAVELPPNVEKVYEHQQNLAQGLTFLIALIAGMLTFTSPCGFIVLPTYLAFALNKRSAHTTAAFSLGLVISFSMMGLIAGVVGSFFSTYQELLATISGAFLILFGILLFLNKGFAIRQYRMKRAPTNLRGFAALGFFFGMGWSPCIGPVLASIGFLAANMHLINAVLLFTTYAFGIIIPLTIFSYASDRYNLSRYVNTEWKGKPLYNLAGGTLLILVGSIILVNKGTSILMEKIPEYAPWNMEWYVHVNRALLESTIFTSQTAQALGLITGIALLGALIWRLKR